MSCIIKRKAYYLVLDLNNDDTRSKIIGENKMKINLLWKNSTSVKLN